MLNYCQLYLWEHISMKFQVNSKIFFEEDLFEFDICKMLANLFTFQCIKLQSQGSMLLQDLVERGSAYSLLKLALKLHMVCESTDMWIFYQYILQL